MAAPFKSNGAARPALVRALSQVRPTVACCENRRPHSHESVTR